MELDSDDEEELDMPVIKENGIYIFCFFFLVVVVFFFSWWWCWGLFGL
jgi:hypothetical protein